MNTETQLHPDEQLQLLADGTRRRLLVALLDDTLDSLPVDITEGVRDNEAVNHIELYHVHLPKLDDSGFVEWDREQRRVSRGPQFSAIEPLLTLLQDNRDELTGEWL